MDKDMMNTHTHTHIEEYYSVIKRMNIAICSNMDEPRDYETK